MFSFQGTPPRFHRAAACSVVQGQLPSRLGHRPPHAGHACRDVEHVRGLSGRSLLLGCISITHFQLLVQWFSKKVSPDALQGISGAFFRFYCKTIAPVSKSRCRGSKTSLRQYKCHTTGCKKCQAFSTPSVARTTNTSRYQLCHFVDQYHLCRPRHKHIRIPVISLYHSVLLSYPAQQHINALVMSPCRDQLRHCV